MSELNGLDCVNLLLEKLCISEEITNPKYEIKEGAVKGDGYMSVIYLVKIISDKKTFSVIIKTAPQIEQFRQLAFIPKVYFQEIYFYDKIFPEFRKLQVEKKVDDPFASVPKCYETSLLENCEGLVLENLNASGYQLWDRKKPMNSEHISFVLREYGRYHALSFHLREQNEELYNEFASKITDFLELFSKGPQNQMIAGQMKTISELFDHPDDKQLYERFKRYTDNYMENLVQCYSKNMDKYTVLAHGDCWCNNMMFKYEDAENPMKPIKMCFLDFQLMKVVTPVIDVLHFFYTASPKDVLDNYKHYMDIYYTSLSSHLEKLGTDVATVYPRTKFDEHWKKYCTYGLGVGVLMVKMMVTETEEVPDFAKAAEAGESLIDRFNYVPRSVNYKQWIRDIVSHFVENDFI